MVTHRLGRHQRRLPRYRRVGGRIVAEHRLVWEANHGPIPEAKWPAMTMEFNVANETLLKTLKPGAKVAVEFVERQPGEWVITSVKPLAAGQAATGSAAHAGH